MTPRLLVLSAIAILAVAGAILLMRGGEQTQTPFATSNRAGLPFVTAIPGCPQPDFDPGIASASPFDGQSIDDGILAPTLSADGLAMRSSADNDPCLELTPTP